MKSRQWTTLAWSTLVIVLLGVGLSVWRDHDGAGKPRPAFGELEGKINEVTKVKITGVNQSVVTLERADQSWVVAEKSRYPADTGNLRKELLQLAQLQLLEAKTKKPENFAQLGVQGVDQAGSETVEVQVFGNNNVSLAHILIGKSAPGGAYIRLGNEPQTWLASARPNFSAKAEDWLEKEIINVEAQRVRKVSALASVGKYVVEKPEGQETPVLQEVVKGRSVKENEVRRLVGALANLRFDDVVPVAQVPAAGAKTVTSRFETSDGLVVEVNAFKEGEKVYASMTAAAVPVQQKISNGAGANPALVNGKEQAVAATAPPAVNPGVQGEAEKLNRRAKGWVYVIPAFQGELFLFVKENLLEPLIKLKGKK